MSNPYDPRQYYNGRKPAHTIGHLVGRIGIVLKAMVADQTEEGSVILDGIFYKAKALETVSAFDSVIIVAVSNEILHIRKYVVDVDVVSGGAGGGLAQLQVKNSSDAWTNVGWATGNERIPVEIIASVALDRTWTITETVPISNAYLAYLANLDIPLSTLMPSEFPLPSAQIASLQNIRALTALDIVTVDNLLNPHPVSLSSIPNPSNLDVALSTRLKPADLNLDGDKDLQVDVKTLPSVTVGTLPALPSGTNNIGDVDVASMPEDGTVVHINKTATGDLITPTSGKAIKILGFFFYSTADITVELRFKTSGSVIGGLTTKGVCGMNLIGMKKPQGSTNEIVEVYLSNTGTVKGWVSYSEV